MSNKPHWSERAKAGLHKSTQFVAENGTKLGLTGGATLALIGAGLAGAASTAADPALAASYQSGAGAFVLASVLKAGGFSAAEAISKRYLKSSDGLFDSSWKTKASRDMRGATPLPVNDELNDPTLQTATKKLFGDLASSPDTRAEIISLIKASPMARRALTSDDTTQAAETIAPANINPDDLEDSAPSPSM